MSKMNSMLSQIDLIEGDVQSAAERSIKVLNLNNNPFDTGKAIEALCKILEIKLESDFNLMGVDKCEHLQIIQKSLLNSNDKNIVKILSKEVDILLSQCS